ncbi:PqqD family protein [Thermodesulfatator atlanticus]|uniref:PqqD family protein n=1 Tax=Thermodesulfatator atlanticus TaxID=501497 RepID=UPI0003B5DF09|nr:PqqD family protein [Thermodesulfatator atlanticus]
MERLSRLAISEEGFIFDPVTGNSFTTNKVGLWILTRLKEGKSPSQILAEMTEHFEVDQETAERDLTDFLEQLKNYKLI